MRNVSDKRCRGNQNTHFMFSDLFLENHTVYEKMWEHIVEAGQTTCALRAGQLWPHSQFTAFPVQQWLHERASMLRYV